MKGFTINRLKSNSIKKQLFINIILLVVFTAILTSVLSIYLYYKIANDNLQSTDIIITIAIAVTMIIISLLLTMRLSRSIVNPLTEFAARLNDLAEGDIHTEVEVIDRNDEIGQLSKAIYSIVQELNSMINEMTCNLVAIDEGDFTLSMEREYFGDFKTIGEAITKINLRLNRLMTRIIDSSKQVAEGADQIAASSQILSQGTTEQASSIEELAATLSELSDQTNQNAINAGIAKKASDETSMEVENGNRHMLTMVKAMEEIKGTSIEISKIIKTIDDIAFQTNILALNAAVEAARAGAAGKGFAVVAEEVRNLASKSAEAAHNTTQLIESSLTAVENGSKIVDETEESLRSIVEKVKTTVSLVEEIAAASEQQAIGTSQVSVGVEQISAVVQTNSATSEESAAASEELSGLAQILKGLVDGIKLKNLTSFNID